ncbi:MAG: ATP-binding cassette domain-containing protein [Bauldia sp.]|nr:ATP-binding cassette domain-containing protein [Bauldia sp.]
MRANSHSGSGSELAVEAIDLRRSFGETKAADGISLTIPRGMVFGLLGPNGAGKTTTVRILTTLLRPDSGVARVAGFDVTEEPDEVRRRIGLVGQYASVDEIISGRQNLILIGRLYGMTSSQAKRRADELLERFDLLEPGKKAVKTYSGGMRRRLDLAASLVVSPSILFLDEPTTGLDPNGRAATWDVISTMTKGGTTVLLTTQYLEEADRFAEKIAVIDHGRVVAEGSPAELKARLGRSTLVVHLGGGLTEGAATAAVTRFAASAPQRRGDELVVSIDDLAGTAELIKALGAAGATLDQIHIAKASMDDVFFELTGRDRMPEGKAA